MTARSRTPEWAMLGAWLVLWFLHTALIYSTSPALSVRTAAVLSLEAIGTAALLTIPVAVLTRRLPWPRPFRIRFLLGHLLGAAAFAGSWVAATGLLDQMLHSAMAPRFRVARLVVGAWLYVAITGALYAIDATERARQAEALAAQARLAGLRAQLNPHFLFNALHTIVQLITTQPRVAADAVDRLGGLLRTAIDEGRDLIRLADEWAFASGYLAIEQLRLGDRLRVSARIADAAGEQLVPAFTLQTLIENAVRHGVEPGLGSSTITVRAWAEAGVLHLEVYDDGPGALPATVPGLGTGLRRLQDRLVTHYGSRARCTWETAPGAGFRVRVEIPSAGHGTGEAA